MNRPIPAPTVRLGGPAAWYGLILLTVVQGVSLLDRQIVTILAADIKADLGLSDSEIGLVYGTFFAIFYALFSLPLGKLADGWVRTRQIAIGLAAWSLLTVLCGFTRGFGSLSLARTGVAIGESAAGPAGYSLIADWFPKHRRATAFAIYGSGVAVGVGGSIALGGAVVDAWKAAYPGGVGAPLGLKGWQAAFIVAAIPGFILALLVSFLKEPLRGQSDGIIQPSEPRPFRRASEEFLPLVPGLSLYNLVRLGAPKRDIRRNLLITGVVLLGIALFTAFCQHLAAGGRTNVYGTVLGIPVTSHLVQWGTVGFGLFAALSWIQAQRVKDPVANRVMWTSPAFIAMLMTASINMMINYGLTGWGAVYAVQSFGQSPGEVGLKLGLTAMVAGLFGTLLGGAVADWARRRSPRGRLWVLLASTVPPVPLSWWLFAATTLDAWVFRFLVLSIVVCAWLPCVTATLTDLVLPRMRGTATAVLYLGITILGMGSGPYIVGLMSDVLHDLRTSILLIYVAAPISWIAIAVAMRTLERDETTLIERARAAGEAI